MSINLVKDSDVIKPVYKFDMLSVSNRSVFNNLPDNMVIFYGRGRKNNFCVYLGKSIWNPSTMNFQSVASTVSDTYYFAMIKYLVDKYGFDMIFRHHLAAIYNYTGQRFMQFVVEQIHEIVEQDIDEDDRDTAIIAYTLVYYGMVSEENDFSYGSQAPVCGKVIKMYGLYNYLKIGLPLVGKNGLSGACSCLQGKNPQTILQNAAQVGIQRNAYISLF